MKSRTVKERSRRPADFLGGLNYDRAAAMKKKRLRPGDFVQFSSEFGDVWHEVKAVFTDAAVLYAHRDGRPGAYAFFWELRPSAIHRKGAHWKRGECRIVMDSTGRYGDRESPPLPTKYRGS